MDCIKGMERIEDKSIDLILTDPPYGITGLEWDVKPNLENLWKQYNRVIKDNGAMIVTATSKFAVDLINANKKYFRYDLVWEKTSSVGFANSKKMPLRSHELILVYYKKLPTYNPQGLIKIKKQIIHKKQTKKESVYKASNLFNPHTKEYKNYPRSVIKFSNRNNNNIHPTQKPLDLFKYLILTYSNENDVVLDTYIGSGTTAAACLQTKRKFIGFETEERYYKSACERLNI